eukprot:c11034_g1_i2 orf=179-448(-)
MGGMVGRGASHSQLMSSRANPSSNTHTDYTASHSHQKLRHEEEEEEECAEEEPTTTNPICVIKRGVHLVKEELRRIAAPQVEDGGFLQE